MLRLITEILEDVVSTSAMDDGARAVCYQKINRLQEFLHVDEEA